MRRLFAFCIVIGAFFLVTSTAKTATTNDTIAVAGDSTALQADQALQQYLKKKDAKSAGTLLDQDFSWTNEQGQTRRKAQFLKDAVGGSTDSDTEYADTKAREYGQLAVVTGTSVQKSKDRTFFARVWVKRSGGWLLLTHQDTGIVAKDSPNPQPPAAASSQPAATDCENPCRTLPYKPKEPDKAAVVKAYQDVETAVTSHDAKTWADHVADEFVGIGRRYTGTPDTKSGRVGQIGIVSNRVVLPKMLWGEAYVFGDAAIIIADHQPVGEPPYRVIRVWVNRDGRWQLFHRQETTIQKTASVK
jgi:hypothetical protein